MSQPPQPPPREAGHSATPAQAGLPDQPGQHRHHGQPVQAGQPGQAAYPVHAGLANSAAGPAPSGPAPRRRGSRLRPVATIVLGVALLLCVGVAGVAFVVYNRIVAPDRGSPDVAVNNYLIALLVDRNPTRARLFSCANQGRLANLQRFEQDIESREKQLSATISVKIENLQVQRSGDRSATASVDLRRIVTSGVRQSLVDHWTVEVVDEEGWRVCGGAQIE